MVVARPGLEPLTPCSALQELNHYTTAAVNDFKRVVKTVKIMVLWKFPEYESCNLLQLLQVDKYSWIFMPPAWKVRRGHLVIGSSVRLFVCP